MGKKHLILPELAERLELPGEAMPGVVRLIVTDARNALIENHRGLLSYSAEYVAVSAGHGSITLRGENLLLEAMRSGDILIKGRIASVEFES